MSYSSAPESGLISNITSTNPRNSYKEAKISFNDVLYKKKDLLMMLLHLQIVLYTKKKKKRNENITCFTILEKIVKRCNFS